MAQELAVGVLDNKSPWRDVFVIVLLQLFDMQRVSYDHFSNGYPCSHPLLTSGLSLSWNGSDPLMVGAGAHSVEGYGKKRLPTSIITPDRRRSFSLSTGRCRGPKLRLCNSCGVPVFVEDIS